MANGWGGARVPSTPAVVSGPGALSARTDGADATGMSGGMGSGQRDRAEAYGLAQLQKGEAYGLAQLQKGEAYGLQQFNPLDGLTGLGEPGSGGHVMDGVDSILAEQSPRDRDKADVAALHPGMVKAMVAQSMRPDSTPSFRRLVRDLLAAQQ